MDRPDAERVEKTSPDMSAERIETLRDVFPEAFSEGKVDFEKLRAALGDLVDESPERYSFTWAGKRDAIKAFQRPSRGTLAPDKDASVNWDETSHVFIEGENLEVLKLLYRSYFGRVKMIYIDPPYNTGSDLVYPDDFADPLGHYLQATGQTDSAGNLMTSNPETGGRFHSAWLTMMYPRLFLARQLLKDDGVIFVSIDDGEVQNLRILMNEVFGEENALPVLVWNRGHSQQQGIFKEYHEYLLPYVRSRATLESFGGGEGEIVAGAMKKVSKANPASDFTFSAGTRCDAPDGTELTGVWGETETVELVEGRFVVRDNMLQQNVRLRAGWTQLNQMKRYFAGEEVTDTRGQRVLEFYFSSTGKLKCRKERKRITPSTVLEGYGTQSEATKELADLFGGVAPLDYPKPMRLIRDLAQWVCSNGADSIVVDFFAGSCTTAHAVLDLDREDGGNRRFIMVQLPELNPEASAAREAGLSTIAETGKERIRRVIARMREEDKGKLDLSDGETPEDLGFRAFRLVRSSFRSEDDAAGDDGAAQTLFTQPLVDAWTPDGLLHEIALREGFDLAVQIERLPDLATNTVYRITDPHKNQMCHVCLDPNLDAETAKTLGLTRDDLFVCFDSALDDTLAANLELQCRLKVI